LESVVNLIHSLINLKLDLSLESLKNNIIKVVFKNNFNIILVSFKSSDFASSVKDLLSKLKSENYNNKVDLVDKYLNCYLCSEADSFFNKIFGIIDETEEIDTDLDNSILEDNHDIINDDTNNNNNSNTVLKIEEKFDDNFSSNYLNINEMWLEITENGKLMFYNSILDQTLDELPLGASLSKYNPTNTNKTNLNTESKNQLQLPDSTNINIFNTNNNNNNNIKDKEESEHIDWFENNDKEKILWSQLQYKKLTVWMKRPARKQVEDYKQQTAYTEGHYDYNIWYDKYLTDRSDDKVKVASLYKCNVALDTGYTRADYQGNKGDLHFCMFFARGCCAQGANCRYYHRVPTFEDCEKTDNMKDIFGRTRFSAHRQDMGGVGTFTRECKTLYVTNIKGTGDKKDTVRLLYQAFSQWGKIEDINYFDTKACCFIRFSHRCMAEFAKEAMIGQTLIGEDVIIIKWAIEETDKVRKKRVEIEDKNKFVSAFEKKSTGKNKYSLNSSIQNYKKNYDENNNKI
jgi:hypothetical protein